MKKTISLILIITIFFTHFNIVNAISTGNVAKINETEYATLEEAITNAQAGDTITLIDNVNLSSVLTIQKALTIDLNEHQINSNQKYAITIKSDNVKLMNGSISSSLVTTSYTSTILILSGSLTLENCNITAPNGKTAVRVNAGSATIKDCTLCSKNLSLFIGNGNADIIDSNISIYETVDNSKAIYIDSSSSNGLKKTVTINKGTTVENASYGVAVFYVPDTTVNIYGTVKGTSFGVASNGTADTPKANINIYDGANISGHTGVYLPAIDGTTNIYGGNITGSESAVEVRGGKLNISGGTLTSTSSIIEAVPNGNGSTTSGAAVAISPHTHKDDIDVKITGGTFNAKLPVYEVNTDPTACTGNVNLSISGGTFNSTGEKTVTSTDCSQFIQNGKYTHDVSEYVKADYGCEKVNEYYTIKHINHTGGTANCGEKAKCSVCGESYGELDSNSHNFSNEYTIDVEPTCQAVGSKSKHCTRCDEKKDITEIPMIEHTFSNYTVKKAATCTEDGAEEATCDNCDTKNTRTITKLGHNFDENYTIDIDSTCAKTGSKSKHCSRCSQKDDVTVIPVKEHTPSEEVKENTKNETCTEDGSYDLVVYCSVCNKELSRTTNTIPSTEHIFTNYTVVKEATCTEDGSEEATCDNCDTKNTRTISKLSHNFDENYTIDTDSTCTTTGSKSKHCSRCNEKDDITVIPVKEHTPNAEVEENKVDATCTKNGSYDLVVYCSVCNNELNRTTHSLPMIEHKFTNYKVIQSATCTEDGLEEATCDNCDTKKTKTIPKLGHDFNENYTIDTDSTCTTTGSKSKHCSRCNEKDDITVIPVKEHTPSEEVKENVTETSYDLVVYCSVCNKELSRTTSTIPSAEEHTFTNYKVVKEATCTEDGLEEATCDNCDVKNTRTISKLGHNFDEDYTIDKEATCIEAGSKSKHCSRCDEKDDITVIPVNEHTPNTEIEENKINATCTKDGSYDSVVYCSVCNEELSKTNYIIPATGHKFSKYKVIKEATCIEDGIQEANCDNCNVKNVQNITKLNHNWDTHWFISKNPTSTTDGIQEKSCLNNCGQKLYETINKIGEEDNVTNVTKNVEVAPGAPETVMDTNKDILVNTLLTPEEKESVENGETAKIWLYIEPSTEEKMSDEDKNLIEQNIENTETTLTYFDLSLFKQIGNKDSTKIHEPKTPISISMTIPDSLLNNNKSVVRKYYMIRLHNGKVDIINGKFNPDINEFTFETDKFSIYALAYIDVKNDDDNSNITKPEDPNDKPTDTPTQLEVPNDEPAEQPTTKPDVSDNKPSKQPSSTSDDNSSSKPTNNKKPDLRPSNLPPLGGNPTLKFVVLGIVLACIIFVFYKSHKYNIKK